MYNKMYKVKKENIEKVLEVFFSNPNDKFHIRELAQIVKLHPNTILSVVNELKNLGLIDREEKKHIVEVNLKDKNKEVIWRKRLFNLNKFYESGIVSYLEEVLNYPEAIVLYGSYANGTNAGKSDIDIMVISKLKKEINLGKYEKFLGNTIHLMILPKDKISEELFNSLTNGIVVSGYLTNE